VAKIYTKNTWVDEILGGNERYDILENDGAAFKATMQIALSTAVTQAGTLADATKMNNIENGVDAIDTRLNALLTGWIDPGETWTYASATTFTISGDKTGTYSVGDKLKLTQTTVKYFYITAVSYGAPNTTVTVTGGSDYTLANAAITANYYSKAATPAGFPQWLNYTAVVTPGAGAITSYTTPAARFLIVGKDLHLMVRITITNNGTGSGDVRCTVPITPYNNFLGGINREDAVAGFCFGAFYLNSTQMMLTKLDASYPGGTNYSLPVSLWYSIA